MLMDKRESLSFEKALQREDKRRSENYEFIWYHKDVGFYYEQVKHYIDSFGRGNVKIVLYEDFVGDPINIMKEIYRFLEVDEGFTPNTAVKYNVGPTVRNEPFEEFLVKYDNPVKKVLRPILLNTIGKRYTESLVNYFIHKNTFNIKPKTRKRLIEIYRSDILKLGDLIDRDLSGWLS